jgi:hypothetical protein
MLYKCLILALLVCAAHAKPWDQTNDPSSFVNGGETYDYKFDNLKTRGEVDVPWSDTYWPSCQGGISFRWMSQDPQPFQYQTHSKDELKKMSWDDKAALSPAEKYDILNCRYDYPLVQEEFQRTSPQDPSWEGICHGWSPASLTYHQPSNITVTNDDGIDIPFGRSDITALLSFFAAQYGDYGTEQFTGGRCNDDIVSDPSKADSPECADMNAGSYHVIIANQLGDSGTGGFVVDRDRSQQVWNQPVYKFVSQHRKSGGKVTVNTQMTYGKEVEPTWSKNDGYQVTEKYQYTLDLDSDGNIVGGDWKEFDRPDFAWDMQLPKFQGYFGDKLETLYKQATNQANELLLFKRAVHPTLTPLFFAQRVGAVQYLNETDGTIHVADSGKGERKAWIIDTQDASTISFIVDEFDTKRYFDFVKVFEGAQCEGALVATWHGARHELRLPASRTLAVRGSSACVVFSTDKSSEGGDSFRIKFSAN